MVHTVGLLGPNGNVGSATLPPLLKAHEDGRIKLIPISRSSPTSNVTIPPSVEIRRVDYEHATNADWDATVKGIHVFISTMGIPAVQYQVSLVEALARVGDAVTFFPARFGGDWPEDTFKPFPERQIVEENLRAPAQRAKDLGVGITQVHTGLFSNLGLGFNIAGLDVKANTIQANKAQLNNPCPLTSIPYLGRVLADLAARPPEEIANKTYTYVEFQPTGQQLVAAMTKVHGVPTTIKDYTERDAVEVQNWPMVGPSAWAFRWAWETGIETFGYTNEVDGPGKGSPGLEDLMRQYL